MEFVLEDVSELLLLFGTKFVMEMGDFKWPGLL